MHFRRIAVVAAIIVGASSLGGCALADFPIIDAGGPVTVIERDLLFDALAIMMIVVVPVFVLTFWFSWRYRASSKRARYQPDWMSNTVDTVVWVVPAIVVTVLGVSVWTYTHQLDPYKALDPAIKPLKVDVVAEDWKWLFIYPQQGIATVNQLAFPSGVPLSLTITSDTVMNAFFIPALGSQIYAMAGMKTHLNLLANAPGHFVGRNTMYSGTGFAFQRFAAVAMSKAGFDAWVTKVRKSPKALDAPSYDELARPSAPYPVTYYASVEPGLFDRIIQKYRGGKTATHAALAAATPQAAATRRRS